MTKRFTDTEKWRKGFIRGLQGPYKLLWLYILDECDHAGIWHVELDVASVRIGASIDEQGAIEALGNHIVPFGDNKKWFIPDFVAFQYGELNTTNRVHQSVIRQLERYGLYKGHISPIQGAKEKDKEKDKDKEKEKDKEKRGAALPADWEPNAKHREIAIEEGVDVNLEAANFRDHALSKNRKLVNWDAGFRTWLRKVNKFNGKSTSPTETDQARKMAALGRWAKGEVE